MKKLNTIRIMALSLAACALVSGAIAPPEYEIFNYTKDYKEIDFGGYDVYKAHAINPDDFELTHQIKQWHVVFENGHMVASVRYWRQGRAKYYEVDYEGGGVEPCAVSSQKGNGSPLGLRAFGNNKVALGGYDYDGYVSGFGTFRVDRRENLTSVNVSGTFCYPFDRSGTVKLRFNRSLTRKAAASGMDALEYVIWNLERMGYRPPVIPQ